MKYALLLIVLLLVVGCSENKSAPEQTEGESKSETQEIDKQPLPKYNTVREMLEAANDFHEETGTLKFISEDKDNLHVQVSKPVLKEDQESLKLELVKRDIVYVAFQSFAQTDIESITITAVPVDFENPKVYIKKYKSTVKIDRAKAQSILKKYLNSEDFSILYEMQYGGWLPSSKFDDLKFDHLEGVYKGMVDN